jgi:3'-phosphoadenosine 5'-phosphosulfate sulfotransferase (PAPS reductase)/FAD synthetase
VIKHVPSVSGGKDSAATLLLAIERFGAANLEPIFCDTGNEHAEVYAYLDYLEQALGIKINRLRANFDAEIAAKRMFIARDKRTRRGYDTRPVFEADGITPVPKRDGRGAIVLDKKGKPTQKTVKTGGGRRVRWTNKAKRRALELLQPTGNPFLDLCMLKGRFPGRKAQFCTEELKRNPAVEFQLGLIEAGHTVVSWQGIRRDESQNRRNAKKFEAAGGGLYIYRPIVEWTALQVFGYCASKGIKPNPLYLQGMGRVGCMPCINANKAELRQIADRFPEHVARIAEWERLVGACGKRGFSTFFNRETLGPGCRPAEYYAAENVIQIIDWARTTRGGRQRDLLAGLEDIGGCSSSYGLCDSGDAS